MGCFCAGCKDKAIGHRAVMLSVVDQQPTIREADKLKKKMKELKQKMERKFKKVNEELLVTKDERQERTLSYIDQTPAEHSPLPYTRLSSF